MSGINKSEIAVILIKRVAEDIINTHDSLERLKNILKQVQGMDNL